MGCAYLQACEAYLRLHTLKLKTCLLLASIFPRQLAAQIDVPAAPIWCDWGEVCESCGNKLMASIEIKNWTPALHHFTFGHGLAQTWWVQRE